MVGLGVVIATSAATNLLSYRYLKARTLKRRRWDLNICCGRTDGGGINVDVMKHADVPRYVQVEDIYNLPFENCQFEHVLCSHTVEHVDDPERLFDELRRVGRNVTLVIPPLWDITAALNLLEHRHVFLTVTKEHRQLPRFVKLPLATFVQKRLGQVMHA